jgi:hypothetical protein
MDCCATKLSNGRIEILHSLHNNVNYQRLTLVIATLCFRILTTGANAEHPDLTSTHAVTFSAVNQEDDMFCSHWWMRHLQDVRLSPFPKLCFDVHENSEVQHLYCLSGTLQPNPPSTLSERVNFGQDRLSLR